ncbi:hypothetical protein DL93DRAFT_2042467, partial [Clavulina sp. PMI_390]
CLSGTRTDILDAIVTWAVGGKQPAMCEPYLQILDPDQQMLWLYGVAGSGKSSIAMSVGRALDGLNMLGSYYGFTTANRAALSPSNLFSTISLHLVKQFPLLQPVLLDIMLKSPPRIRESTSPTVQLQTFLVPLLDALASLAPLQKCTVIIDALDESGSVKDRQEILTCLAGLASRLPLSIHILVTARFESDIQKAVSAIS